MNKNRRIKFIATTMLMTSLYVAPVILQSGVQIVRAAESDAEALIGRIENLPPVEDLNETHAEEVKSLMTAYSQLKMSDRIAVTNYELLKKDFDALVKKGILTNEDNTILQEQGNIYLYEKLGYKRTGEIENIKDGMDIVYFHKD